MCSEDFFSEFKSKLLTFRPEEFGQARVAAVEDGHLALPLLLDLGEHFVPVGPASIRPGLEAGDEVPLLLVVENVQRQLEGHRLHVRLLEGGGDVHVHL